MVRLMWFVLGVLWIVAPLRDARSAIRSLVYSGFPVGRKRERMDVLEDWLSVGCEWLAVAMGLAS